MRFGILMPLSIALDVRMSAAGTLSEGVLREANCVQEISQAFPELLSHCRRSAHV
jgi:hypothetical protein